MTDVSEEADARTAFDASSIPGMRDRLTALYAEFRAVEAVVNRERGPPSAGGSIGHYRERECPGCGTSSVTAPVVQSARGLTLLRCAGCGLTYARSVLEEESDATRYRASDIDAVTLKLRDSAPYLQLESARAHYYLDRIAACAGVEPGTLLEVGCGSGTFLVEAQKRGWEGLGIEPGCAAAEQARQRGARVVNGYFPKDLPDPDRRHNLIAMLDVLEHIIAPRLFLREVRARLAPEGILFVQVPNWDSLLVQAEGARSTIVAPGHWSYFTRTTLLALLESEGFVTLGAETVVSEIDRLTECGAETVAATLARLRPGLVLPQPLRAQDLYRHDLGYKLIGVFRRC